MIVSASRSSTAAVVPSFRIEAAILSHAVEGKARDVGQVHAALVREVDSRKRLFCKPVRLLSGGETNLALTGRRRRHAGRHFAFLLSLAVGIVGMSDVWALAADTDRVDGLVADAGAFADGTSTARISSAGINARRTLRTNEAWTAFDRVHDRFPPTSDGDQRA